MTEAVAEPGKIDIARVLQQLFRVLGRNFVTFLVLAALLVGLPHAIMTYFHGGVVEAEDIRFGPGLVFGGLLSIITGAILQGTLMYGAVQDLNGQRVSVSESLAMGLRSFLPLIGASILLALGLAFGFILLIVPGVILACIWVVTIPALVAERRGVFESFSRSAELTRGNRWRIFALFCIWLVAAMLFSAFLSILTGVNLLVTDDIIEAATSPLAVAVSFIESTVSTLIGATGAAVLYVELREAREALGPRGFADMFA